MSTLENIKNRLIDRILVTQNEKLLAAISNIFDSTQTSEKLSLNSEQIEMLMMSEQDIENGNLISETEQKQIDSEWMD